MYNAIIMKDIKEDQEISICRIYGSNPNWGEELL